MLNYDAKDFVGKFGYSRPPYFKEYVELYGQNYEIPEVGEFLTPGRIAELDVIKDMVTPERIRKEIYYNYKHRRLNFNSIERFEDSLERHIRLNIGRLYWSMVLLAANNDYDLINLVWEDRRYDVSGTDNTQATENGKASSNSTSVGKQTDESIAKGDTTAIVSDTPGNKLNIENIKSGESASTVQHSDSKNENKSETDSKQDDETTSENEGASAGQFDTQRTTLIHREGNTAEGFTMADALEREYKLHNHQAEIYNKFVKSLEPAFLQVIDDDWSAPEYD